MSTEKITRKYFDYNALPDKEIRSFLKGEETAIRAAHRRVQNDIIEIGQHLMNAKERVGHGPFMEWAEGALGYTFRHATGFIQVAQTFGKMELNSTLPLSQTALFALASPSVSNETREVAVEMAESGDLKTTADAKALIEAAKPPKVEFNSILNPEIEREIDQIEESDFDDTDPFADEDLKPEIGVMEPEEEASQLPGGDYEPDEDLPQPTPKETTLKQRVKNAEVFHDTLGTTPKPEELNDEAWLETLPIYRVLKQKQHRGLFLRRDLIATRQLLEALNAFEHHARRAFDFKNPSGTPAENRVVALAAMPRPLDWQICAPCKGNGCNRCAHSGYDVTGAGISPLRVESGEAVL